VPALVLAAFPPAICWPSKPASPIDVEPKVVEDNNEQIANTGSTVAPGLIDIIRAGDCLQLLKEYPDACVDLIVTSPPYASKRTANYSAPSVEAYNPWLLERAAEFYRVLKPEGSFVLNIKEAVQNGERQTYVMELVMALRAQGWLWTDDYPWIKKNCFPGKWPNRFRDGWEHCHHFTKQRQFYMNQEAVMVPMGEATKRRLKYLSKTDQTRDPSSVGSGFGKNISHWLGREKAYPTNVIHFATECGNQSHPAAFPLRLPAWFIKLFTKEDGLVLDPYVGSGTTALAAKILGRHFLGFDICEAYCEIAKACLENEYKPDREI
jgi:site-specific DNA-methyltransferase (adenine-specific)